jgi:hypothetical protein
MPHAEQVVGPAADAATVHAPAAVVPSAVATVQTPAVPRVGSLAASWRERDGPGERRRSSLAVVALVRDEDARRCVPVVARQLRLLATAGCIAVLASPFVVIAQPLIALSYQLLPNVRVSQPCKGLHVDELLIGAVVLSVYISLLSILCILVLMAESIPKLPRILPHMLLGFGAGAFVCVCFSFVASAPFIDGAICSPAAIAAVFFTTLVSLGARHLATVRGTSCNDAAKFVVACMAIAMSCAIAGTMSGWYVALSVYVSGLAGIAVNGKPRGRLAACRGES